jgi:hypothetical protein
MQRRNAIPAAMENASFAGFTTAILDFVVFSLDFRLFFAYGVCIDEGEWK